MAEEEEGGEVGEESVAAVDGGERASGWVDGCLDGGRRP